MKEVERVLLRTMRDHLQYLTKILLDTTRHLGWEGHSLEWECVEKSAQLEVAYNAVFPLRRSKGKKA